MDIKGKVIVITGASMGIGAAAARALSAKGAKLVLAARSTDKLDKLAKELDDAIVVTTDMTSIDDIERLVDTACKHFGRIDVLVNNAGQGLYGAVEHTPIAEYERIFRLNVIGPLLAMQQVIPVMRKQGGGTIVNISSLVSKNYFPYLGAYASTKYALNALSHTARAELARDNIVVSTMLPGLTDTDFGKNAVKADNVARTMDSRNRPAMPNADTAEQVAERIAYTIETGDAEVTVH